MRITIDISAEEVRKVMELDSMPILPIEVKERLIGCIQEIDRTLDALGELEV